jgi:hypothetical protein
MIAPHASVQVRWLSVGICCSGFLLAIIAVMLWLLSVAVHLFLLFVAVVTYESHGRNCSPCDSIGVKCWLGFLLDATYLPL